MTDLGDAVDRDVADRGVHGDVALRDVPLHGCRAGDRADHDLGHEVGQRAQDRAHEIGAVRAADTDGARDLAVGEFLKQYPGAAFDHHRGGVLARALIERLPGRAGRRGNLRAGHVGSRTRRATSWTGRRSTASRPRAPAHRQRSGLPCSWCSASPIRRLSVSERSRLPHAEFAGRWTQQFDGLCHRRILIAINAPDSLEGSHFLRRTGARFDQVDVAIGSPSTSKRAASDDGSRRSVSGALRIGSRKPNKKVTGFLHRPRYDKR